MGSSYSSTSDVERYRQGYPGQEDDLNAKQNIKFYGNQISSRPDGDFIDAVHKDWWGQYELLERHHGYVQWLFPIREHGLNGYAQVLQLHEAQQIASNPQMKQRAIKSYELMLDFYGMKLVDQQGHIARSDNFRDRYLNLNHSFHNYLRITRILKFLGEIGLESMKVHFIEFILNEVKQGELGNTYDSCSKYWVEVLKSDEERARMKQLAASIKPPERKYRRWSDSDEEDKKEQKYAMVGAGGALVGSTLANSNNNNNNTNNSTNTNNNNTTNNNSANNNHNSTNNNDNSTNSQNTPKNNEGMESNNKNDNKNKKRQEELSDEEAAEFNEK